MQGWGPFDLSGKRAIVTGGATGIGLGIAKRLVQAGADVLVTDIDDDAGQAAVAALSGGPGKAVYLHADVTDPGAGQAMVEECVRQFGRLDVLVNNAGIYPSVPGPGQSAGLSSW